MALFIISFNTCSQIHKSFSVLKKVFLVLKFVQTWFKERFNAAVFEDELKWYSTEPQQGEVNYTIPDQMLDFVRKNKIIARGHNIFWEDPRYTPSWVRHLTGPELKSAVNSRIQSLMKKYKNEFIHWDVDNEMLHYDFYEQRLGINTSLEFFQTAQQLDPLAKLFMNDYNVIETCSDMNSTVDAYSSKLRDLNQVGVFMDGIGLEGHFTVPNPPFIRAALDKLATQKLPIWLTEVDISKNLDKETQVRVLQLFSNSFVSAFHRTCLKPQDQRKFWYIHHIFAFLNFMVSQNLTNKLNRMSNTFCETDGRLDI